MNSETILELHAIANILQHVLLTDPSREHVNQFKQEHLMKRWPLLTHAQLEKDGIQLLDDFFNNWENTEVEETALRLDFTNLFCGLGAPLSPPWGSVYLSEEQLLNGPSTKKLIRFYDTHNIQVSYQINEPVDHLGLMFTVVAHLLKLIAEQDEFQYQENLLSELLQLHLFPFAGRVFELMRAQATTPYYQGFACLGENYLKALATHFKVIRVQHKLYL